VPPESLAALIEDYVTRDGTDYGSRETSLEDKVSQVHEQLRLKQILLLFDVEAETWDLLPADQAAQWLDN